MPNISAQDLEVVRLTALFVAKNGRPFMTSLSQRETRNFQFDFLRPNHSLYQFFTRLVDQYTELLRYGAMDGEAGKAEKERIRELERNAKSRFNVLGRAKQRAEWSKFQEQQKQKKEEEEEKEKRKFCQVVGRQIVANVFISSVTYAQIDWHDFVVVESVLFNEADDQAELPAPTSLSDLQSASLEQKAMMSLAPHNMRIEEAMPTEDEIYYNPYAPQQPYQQLMQPPPIPQQSHQAYSLPPPPPPPDAINNDAMDVDQPHNIPTTADEDDEEAHRIRERTEARARARQAQAEAKGASGPMKIRSDYVPRAAAQAASRRGVQMALCPNCKQQIPFSELDEHMKSRSLSTDQRRKQQANWNENSRTPRPRLERTT